MAINAAVHSHPGYVQESGHWIISGVLSGLLIFPVFCGLLLMFNMRPSQVKKQLIKKAYSTRESDFIQEQKRAVEHQTSRRPPPGYALQPPPPPGSMQGQTTLLTLPAPSLPPLPAGMPGMPALPPPPMGMGGAAGLPGMLALPPFPGAMGAPGTLPLPPPPRYPPPGQGGQTTKAIFLPPHNWPAPGNPPPQPKPFPALM